MSTYFFSLSQHLSCHRNDRNAFVNFLFPQIRIHEWFEGQRNPRASKNKKTVSFCCLLKLQMDPIRARKWMANSKRKDIRVYMAFIWTLVLESGDPLPLSCIFLRCFHRETVNSRKHVRDIVKHMRFPSISRVTCGSHKLPLNMVFWGMFPLYSFVWIASSLYITATWKTKENEVPRSIMCMTLLTPLQVNKN